jgi:hypothetical protein
LAVIAAPAFGLARPLNKYPRREATRQGRFLGHLGKHMRQQTITIEVGPVPAEENAAQVGRQNYADLSRIECAVFIRQLQRVFEHPSPDALTFERRAYRHELGTYHEVVAIMTISGAEVFDEAKIPVTWDHIARAEMYWLRMRMHWRKEVEKGACEPDDVPEIFRQQEAPDFPDHPTAMWWAMGFMPMPAGPAIAIH